MGTDKALGLPNGSLLVKSEDGIRYTTMSNSHSSLSSVHKSLIKGENIAARYPRP
jgi:hypothetical protein